MQHEATESPTGQYEDDGQCAADERPEDRQPKRHDSRKKQRQQTGRRKGLLGEMEPHCSSIPLLRRHLLMRYVPGEIVIITTGVNDDENVYAHVRVDKKLDVIARYEHFMRDRNLMGNGEKEFIERLAADGYITIIQADTEHRGDTLRMVDVVDWYHGMPMDEFREVYGIDV